MVNTTAVKEIVRESFIGRKFYGDRIGILDYMYKVVWEHCEEVRREFRMDYLAGFLNAISCRGGKDNEYRDLFEKLAFAYDICDDVRFIQLPVLALMKDIMEDSINEVLRAVRVHIAPDGEEE